MTSRFMLIFAAISGFIFVALGAFGAHVLSQSLGAAEMAWIHTGLEYQAFHTPGDFWSGGGDAASDQYLVLLEQRVSGVRDRAVQRQPLLSGAVSFTSVGVRDPGGRRKLPRRLGFNVNWCNSSET